ncbi:hypothetical protein [Streptomyces sp. NPDC050355]|uniref:hypothetical protein n=1 Tax=Streptomyces sp. NPDC050355 TaxID=3365609 RepID=UPI0037B5127E
MMCWMRCYWKEEDTWFFFEVDAEGWVTQQVELHGPEQTPLAAASLREWQRAWDAGTLADYEKEYGLTVEPPVSEWEGVLPADAGVILALAEPLTCRFAP